MSQIQEAHHQRETPVSRPSYRQQSIDPSITPIPASRLISIPSTRRGRRSLRNNPIDPHPNKFYGDAVIQKIPNTTRILFQNVKGFTNSSTKDDYRYYMACLHGLDADIAGLTETNTCWSHVHLRSDLQQSVRSYYKQSKIAYGSPSAEVDTCPPNEF